MLPSLGQKFHYLIGQRMFLTTQSAAEQPQNALASIRTLAPTYFPSTPVSIYIWLVQQVAFHVVGIIFEWCDRNAALQKFKVRVADKAPYKKLLPRVLFNQCFILLPSMIASEAWGVCFTGQTRELCWHHLIKSLLALAAGHDVM